MIKRSIYICLLLCLSLYTEAQQINKSETGIFLLKGAELELLDEGRIKADILIQNGIIQDIDEEIIHPGAKVIDVSGQIVFPGMIDSGTRLGLSEVGSISLTQDHSEIGEFTPQMKTLTAINPNSVSIPVTRVNGITTVLAMPSRGRFPGTAALIDLHGYTPDQMYAGFEAVVFNYPSTGRRSSWDRRSDEDIQKEDKKQKKKLDEFWDKVELYAKLKKSAEASGKQPKYNPQLDALSGVVNEGDKLLIEVNKKSDILSALEWVNEKGLDCIFLGVSEGYMVADSLAKYDIPVVTGPILRMPGRSSDHYAIAYENAGIMQKAGVKVAIRTNESENVRNLPYNAGFAAAYGMGWKEAYKAVSIVPAQIFGLDDRYGSIERGKVANLFVANGDPFETKTQISHLFIRGYKVALESRHTYLYDEFLEREPGLGKGKND